MTANFSRAIDLDGSVARVVLKVAEPRSIVFHLLGGIDLVGGLCSLAVSENATYDRPRLGGLLGVAQLMASDASQLGIGPETCRSLAPPKGADQGTRGSLAPPMLATHNPRQS